MVSSTAPIPEPPLQCPVCTFRAANEYGLIIHFEDQHTDDHRDTTDAAPAIGEHPGYIRCPERDCEEFVYLVDLQTHLDFHDAEHLSMEQAIAATANTTTTTTAAAAAAAAAATTRRGRGERDAVERPRRHRSERRRDRDRERGAEGGSGGGGESSGKHRRRRSSRRHSQDPEEHHRHRRRDRDRDQRVSFVRSPSPPRGNWWERFVFAIVHPVPPVEPSGGSSSRRRSESVPRRKSMSEGLQRSGSKKESSSLRRSESRRGVELRKGEPRRHVSPSADASASASPPKKRSSSSSSKTVNGIKKLGKSDLGPYAHEAQMPAALREQLERGGRPVNVVKIDPVTGRRMNVVQIANETPDLIPVIAMLSERDPEVVKTYLCHPGTKHVGKQIPKEGGFCGYRNIQMMISFIQAAYPRGSHPFEGRIPTILRMQDLIEEGWERGINSTARLETGGIRGTRKYIGTSEAQTLFTTVGLHSRARAFIKSPDPNSQQTPNALLSFVEEYFQGTDPVDNARTMRTTKPPIYLQHSGHSMTIIGLERWRDGSASLLVFDPFFSPKDHIKALVGARRISSRVRPEAYLKVYRRKMHYLAKYKEFEVILLDP